MFFSAYSITAFLENVNRYLFIIGKFIRAEKDKFSETIDKNRQQTTVIKLTFDAKKRMLFPALDNAVRGNLLEANELKKNRRFL